MTTVDELLMRTEDEIDYDTLEIPLLVALARQQKEPFVATSALAKLSTREGAEAARSCEEILRRVDDDRYLRAFAMTLLYSLTPERAIEHMKRLVDQGDEKVLGAMVENVMSDLGRFKGAHESLIRRLLSRVRETAGDDFSDRDEVREFTLAFGVAD